ncbi:MAG: trypsin-like serine protease [Deltaproteobacteria bacterium]|nr:trypsin-like serine protease [Deltaproteobacteria bacterium]
MQCPKTQWIALWCLASGLVFLWAAPLVLPGTAHAQSGSASSPGGMSSSATQSSAAALGQVPVEQYWTPRRLLNAKPVELHPQVGANGLPIAPQGLADTALPEGESGAPPSVKVPPNAGKVLIPPTLLPTLPVQTGVMPFATSNFGAYFTTSRVFPANAVQKYPYSTAGKLFFTIQGVGNFLCSASVLRPRIVVTAGHCVAEASTNPALRHFYTNWLFIPAYKNGKAPYGTWTVSGASVTNTWYFSDGSVPNAQDVGLLVMNDQFIGSAVQRIGDVTGWLGWQTNALSNNHITVLGYPVNLDRGLKMAQTTAQTFESGGNNTYIYGSAMRGGVSGGPWIQDFGVQPVGAPPVVGGGNLLIAVSSYGPVDTTPQFIGASNLDSRFVDLLNAACGDVDSGNCSTSSP